MKVHVPAPDRSAGLRCYHKRAILFRARGLNSRGKPYRRTPNFETLGERIDAVRKRNLNSWSRRSVSRILDGLTTRGGLRVLRLKYFDSFILASEIDAAALALDKAFKRLPPAAAAACIQLASSLAALRRRLPQKENRA